MKPNGKKRKNMGRKASTAARLQKQSKFQRQEAYESRLKPNAKMIVEAMKEAKIKGNYRDYVLLVGDRLIDYRESHGLAALDGLSSARVEGMAVMHKKRLKNILPEDVAALFWHPRLGRMC
jgi:hypothetical protein